METMRELKQYLKNSAIQIRELKSKHKEVQRKYKGGGSTYWSPLWDKRHAYRHYHIAYSELRGKTRDQIEASYPYEGQSQYQRPNEALIRSIKEKIKPV